MACAQNSGGIALGAVTPRVAASAMPSTTVLDARPTTAAIAARAQSISLLSGPKEARPTCAPQKSRYEAARSTVPMNVFGLARMPSKTIPSFTSALSSERSASPPASVMSVNRNRPSAPLPASANNAPRMPKLALAKIGKLTLCLAAGTVIMAIKGIASSVPTAVERPSCHQTSGASDERFQRTNPNGTEYTTADTAMQIHTANDRSYSRGSP